MDHPPEKSKELKDWMNIRDDYFAAIADDLTGEEAKAQIKELQQLCELVVEAS
jgi:hypothetical protein